MYPSRLLPQFQLRFSSKELKDWLTEQSKANHRTLTAEINFHLEQVMLKVQQEQSANDNSSINIQSNNP